MGLSTHQDFVSPDREERDENIDRTRYQIDMAHKLGIPTIRINTGRWGTIPSFSDLIDAKGIEPVLEGYTEEEGFEWVIDSIGQLIPMAEEYGVVMGLESLGTVSSQTFKSNIMDQTMTLQIDLDSFK